MMLDLTKISGFFRYDPEAPMVFNSGLFLLLFPLFVICYYLLRERREWRMIYVILFSYFFYYKSSGLYFILLFGVSVIDYLLGEAIYNGKTRMWKRVFVVLSLVVNLGLLGYYKYAGFFHEIWSSVTGSEFLPWTVLLPVGISFFTFQSLSYTIDVYRGEVVPLRKFTDYAFYVSFFPQLVAGPIVRARDFIPQMLSRVTVTKEMFGRGVFLILTGLFKKAVISDYISINFVDRIFDTPELFSGVENLMAVYGYALQIYCDFSGYSDMAIGIALLLGFHFKMNFNSPYQSQSVTEFWKRWHISLSTWLRDYLYIPLGGNRRGKWRTYLNLMATMLLGGLWHGASWRFIFWGGWHGLWLTFERLDKKGRFQQLVRWGRDASVWKRTSMPYIFKIIGWGIKNFALKAVYYWKSFPVLKRVVRTLLTFHIVCLGWIFFRASSFSSAWTVIRQIFSGFHISLFPQWLEGYSSVALVMLIGYVTHFLPDRVENTCSDWLVRSPLAVKAILLAGVIFIVMQVKSSEILPFIYFQF